MRTRAIAAHGITVGAVGLGCMGMTHAYEPADRDEARSAAVVHRALELGVTLVDTADVYGPYTNELLVGRALRGRRDRAVLATKVGLVTGPGGGLVRNGTPEHVRACCDGSLRRLQTDQLDLYQLHRVDPVVPVEETWGAMARLVAQGKVRALGISEATVDELERCQQVFPVSAVQSELSLWTRQWLDDVVPWCAARGVGFLAYAPLGRGFLTGRYAADASFDPGDFRAGNPRFTPAAVRANQRLVDRVRAVAAVVGATPAQVALAWVLAQGPHVVPIPGTRRLEYLEENAAADDVVLDADQLAELDALPAPVGERY